MKKKTWLKEGVYQKLDNTKGKRIKGALDFNKEVLDTLVDKDLVVTANCCNYFPSAPVVGQITPLPTTIAAGDWPFEVEVPIYGMFIIEDPDTPQYWGLYIRERSGSYHTIYLNN